MQPLYRADLNYLVGVNFSLAFSISLSIFIEVKGSKGKATANQIAIRDKLEEAGGIWQLCRSVEQVQDFLEGLIKLRGK